MKAVISLAALLLGFAVVPIQASDFRIDWWSLSGGGGTSTGGTYAAKGVVGQSGEEAMSGGAFELSGGISGGGLFAPVTNAVSLAVTKLQVKLSFAKPNADSCSLTATLSLGAGFSPLNKPVTLDIGGVEMATTLGAKGSGVSEFGTVKMKAGKTAGLWTLTAKMGRGSWQSTWAAHGLVNATIAKPGTAVTLPVNVAIGDQTFGGEKTLIYSATAGKSGSAK